MLHDVTLEGHGARLVPLDDTHAAALAAFVDDRVWAGMSSPLPVGIDGWRAEVDRARATPGRVALAVLDAATGEVRGSTSFYDLDTHVLRVEIGHTYYAPRWWGTSNNPACKLLMLTHAFETWGMQRVAFRADTRNTRSVGAIRRLGAVPEGVLRSHRLAPDGTRGDSAYFSILPDEWPAVRAGLLARLAGTTPDV
ncbi:GNAT family N-acetyltransferase [Cellulomonas algicola]|uniref:GNAT family N-acetyltransferase n=1 Tax=Cellulomonas algicola TaxID=2071633 RepID=UPI001C3FDDC3|nr:GNAT family protein [Cellulomonas algicola]